MPRKLVAFLILLLFPLTAFAYYKTGVDFPNILFVTAKWDGSKWKVKVSEAPLYREAPGTKLKTKTVVEETWDYPDGGMTLKDLATALNGVLEVKLPEYASTFNAKTVIATFQKDFSNTYVASWDGERGFYSYGWQKAGNKIGLYYYYSKSIDTSTLPPPPAGLPTSDPSLATNLGKYRRMIISLTTGEVISDDIVDVNGAYDAVDDSGIDRFISDVVEPDITKYGLSYAIVQYMYSFTPVLDADGKYKISISIPHREVEVCPDGSQYDWDTNTCRRSGGDGVYFLTDSLFLLALPFVSNGRCDITNIGEVVFKSPGYYSFKCSNGAVGKVYYFKGFLIEAIVNGQKVSALYNGRYISSNFRPNPNEMNYLDIISPTGSYRIIFHKARSVSVAFGSNVVPVSVSLGFHGYILFTKAIKVGKATCRIMYEPLGSILFGSQATDESLKIPVPVGTQVEGTIDIGGTEQKPEFRNYKETIQYSYQVEADYKTYLIDSNLNRTLIGYGKRTGNYFSYYYEKEVNFPALYNGQEWTPGSAKDLLNIIITPEHNRFYLISASENGIQVGPLTVK